MKGYEILIPNKDEIVIGGLGFFIIFFLFKKFLYPKIEKRIIERRNFINDLIEQSIAKNEISERNIENSKQILEKNRLGLEKLKNQAIQELENEIKIATKDYQNHCNMIYNQTKLRCERLEQSSLESMKSNIAHIVVDIVQRSIQETISEQKSRELTELVVDRFASKEN